MSSKREPKMMKGMKEDHTPGPWMVEDTTFSISAVHPSGNHERMRTLITEMSTGTTNRKENARLIASSPDLLASCKALLKMVACNVEKTVADAGTDEVLQSDIRNARRAIRKAEGLD